MKGPSESNINVWFPFMHSQKWNSYFQTRTIMFCLPVPTLIYLWEIYIFPGSLYVDRFWEYINRSQTHECGECGNGDWPEKEYINGILLAVRQRKRSKLSISSFVCSLSEGSWKREGVLGWDCNCVIWKCVLNQPTPLNMILTRTTRPLPNSQLQPSLPQYSPVSVVINDFNANTGVLIGAEQMLTQLAA